MTQPKYTLPVLFALSLAACAHAPPCPVVPALETPVAIAVATEPPGEMVVEQKMNQKLSPLGAAVFLRVEIDPANFGTARAAALTEMLTAALKKKNFEVRPASSKVHSELTVTSFEDLPRNLRGLSLTWGLRRPHRRPVRWFQQTYAVRSPLDAVWDKFRAKIQENFEALEIAAPAAAPGITADPGCAPRFGFNSDEHGRVTAVVPGSPAQRAGVRAGDVIEAVDSRAPTFDRPDVADDVYVNRVPVPLRLNRDGAIIRTSLRSENVCE